MSSTAEAEMGALFTNAKEAVHMRHILHEMGHPQPCTPDGLLISGGGNKFMDPPQAHKGNGYAL